MIKIIYESSLKKLFDSKLDLNSLEALVMSYGITNFTINNGVVDVDKGVVFDKWNLKKIPFKFGIVKGYFRCCNNRNLKSLENAPEIVEDYFYCKNNRN